MRVPLHQQQRRRIVVQHVNGTAEDMLSQQDQTRQGDAGVPRRQGTGAASIAHAQNHEPQAKGINGVRRD
jgi:hypothetical protein